MNTYTAVLIAILVAAAFAAVIFVLYRDRQRRLAPPEMDGMEGHDFEYYCADILRGCGFTDVRVTRGSGDFGADILAGKDGVSYAVQCKCYNAPVGVQAVQEAYAGKGFYDAMVGAVMTNCYFTRPAVTLAGKLNILLWDREALEDMAESAD